MVRPFPSFAKHDFKCPLLVPDTSYYCSLDYHTKMSRISSASDLIHCLVLLYALNNPFMETNTLNLGALDFGFKSIVRVYKYIACGNQSFDSPNARSLPLINISAIIIYKLKYL
jgi:hypothetical protein